MKKLALLFGIITIVLLTISTGFCVRGFIYNIWNVAILLPLIVFGLISLGMSIAFVIMIKENK